MNYSITEIARVTGGELTGPDDAVVKYVLTDSRSLLYPAATVFFAIPGERHNGHDYIGELYRQGVRCFVVDRLPDNGQAFPDAGFVLVRDVLRALQQLAARHRRRFMTPVIGITGSNGKTVVKEWIFQAIHHEKDIVRSPRSYNSQIGVPLSVCLLDEKYDLAIFEAGISQPGEMERLQTVIMPDIGIFTHLGEAHQEKFHSKREKAQEKLKLFRRCRTVLYCRDCAEIADILENDPEYRAVSRFSWSEQTGADVQVRSKRKENGSTFVVIRHGNQKFDLAIPFTDDASVENALHVACLMLFMGYRPEIINERIAQLEPVAMRLDIKKGASRCTIINDSYNADTGSLAIALDLLARQQQPVKTLILSDILQSGKSQENLYREVAGLFTERNINRLVGIGSEISANAGLFACEKYFFATTDAFLAELGHSIRFTDESILVKGSRNFEFERIVQALEEKVHKTVLEINLDAMVHNYNYFKSLLHPQTKMVVMVKAFAYGSGSVEIASVLQFHRADCLAVAFADEGKELRENGITLSIMVMNPEDGDFDTLIRYRLEPEIYNFRMLEQCVKAASDQGIYEYPVHIKLDTGMHRLGFLEDEIDRLTEQLRRQSSVHVKSVFSHLAGSDDPSLDDFVRQQVSAFRRMSGRIEEQIHYPFLRHILNSAGIERFPEAQFDMVRLGIGLHGISAVDPAKVRQVATLRSIILQIKNIPAGDSVGYNRKFFAASPMRIGIVPIGYADGLHRALGNGAGSFVVNGQRVPLVGNMSMDMCAIDLTDIDAAEGDPVIIFGEEYPLAEIARQMQTIPYEALTRIAPRVKRIYYQE
ncbi:MAG: bifunctional UDP-N-acetylmuramoyl-tripeptide:D-alanyl-D-alanine ligase/alanine racemase [Bacteroidales bacterium]|jgi:alanine racemase|nr:bifunctional UDP-N-acetylmuramoyl-tripeptide:D-alanyl-D-alanine ligase/alanine racemase [Bacteroidales bacterium]